MFNGFLSQSIKTNTLIRRLFSTTNKSQFPRNRLEKNHLLSKTKHIPLNKRNHLLSKTKRCLSTSNSIPKEKNYLGAAVFGSLVLGTFGLGTWQTNRYYWKDELIQLRQKSLSANYIDLQGRLQTIVSTPIDANNNPTDTEELHYTKVSARGEFDHSNEICIGPRVPPKQEHGGGMNISEVGGESSGFFVITPLILENGGTILVNRGWIPNPEKTKFKTQPSLRFTTGVVEVRGVIIPPEIERTFSPPNNITTRRFLWFDPVAACQATGIMLNGGKDVRPLIMNATERCNPGMFPVVRDVSKYSEFHVGLETHATYAATWYALSFFGAIMNYVRFLR